MRIGRFLLTAVITASAVTAMAGKPIKVKWISLLTT